MGVRGRCDEPTRTHHAGIGTAGLNTNSSSGTQCQSGVCRPQSINHSRLVPGHRNAIQSCPAASVWQHLPGSTCLAAPVCCALQGPPAPSASQCFCTLECTSLLCIPPQVAQDTSGAARPAKPSVVAAGASDAAKAAEGASLAAPRLLSITVTESHCNNANTTCKLRGGPCRSADFCLTCEPASSETNLHSFSGSQAHDFIRRYAPDIANARGPVLRTWQAVLRSCLLPSNGLWPLPSSSQGCLVSQ